MEFEFPIYKIVPSVIYGSSTYIFSIEDVNDDGINYPYNVNSLELLTLSNNVSFIPLSKELKTCIDDNNIISPIEYPGTLYIYDLDEPLLLYWSEYGKNFYDMDNNIINVDNHQKLIECKIPDKFVSNGERKLPEKISSHKKFSVITKPLDYPKTSVNNCPLSPAYDNLAIKNSAPLSDNDLCSVFEAFLRRMYSLYPVIVPTELIYKGDVIKLINWKEYSQLRDNGKIISSSFEPLLQPYGGSYRNNNRMVLCILNNGSKVFCQVKYESEKNKISEPDLPKPAGK